MKIKKKVAILMAAYEGEKFLIDQISSILDQKNVEIKIFINLDKSNDRSFSIITSLSKKYKCIKLISYNKRYGSAAINFLNLILSVNFEKFDFISLSDQDDIWMPNKLITAINKLEELNYDVYSSNALSFSNKSKKIILKSQKQTDLDFIFEGGGPGCTYLCKKDFMINFQAALNKKKFMINSVWSHDWLIYAYARIYNYKWYIDSNYYIYYRQHNNNQLGANIGFKQHLFRFKEVISGNVFDYSRTNLIICDEVKNNIFVKFLNKNKKSYFFILLNFYKLRRKIGDKIILFILSIILILIK